MISYLKTLRPAKGPETWHASGRNQRVAPPVAPGRGRGDGGPRPPRHLPDGRRDHRRSRLRRLVPPRRDAGPDARHQQRSQQRDEVHEGLVFDGAGNLYVGNFFAHTINKYDPSGNFLGTFGDTSGIPAGNTLESLVFNAAGDLFAGAPDGDKMIREFDPSGAVIATFAPATEDRGTDWLELGANQTTLFYTSEGTSVLTFDLATSTQGPDFATNLPGVRRLPAPPAGRRHDAGGGFGPGRALRRCGQHHPDIPAAAAQDGDRTVRHEPRPRRQDVLDRQHLRQHDLSVRHCNRQCRGTIHRSPPRWHAPRIGQGSPGS